MTQEESAQVIIPDNSLVSVVVTTYQRETSLIQEAIESVLAQTYRNIELIVVDDNGCDQHYSSKVKHLCSSYEGVIYIRNEKNMGAQYSRNIGIMASSGKYVAFLDDDDIWAPDKIKIQMCLFKDPEVGMVFCDGYSFSDGKMAELGVFREASIYDRPISHELELFNDYIGSTSQAVVKRECFSAVGLFDVDMPARQDYDQWLRICKRYKVLGTPEKLLYYRTHPGERISTNWAKCHESYKLILHKHRDEYSRNKYAKAKLMLRISASAKKVGKVATSVGYLFLAIFASPRCVLDVVLRKVRRVSFSDYYSQDRLNRTLHIN